MPYNSFRKGIHYIHSGKLTLAMENGSGGEDVFPILKRGYSMAMLVYQRVPGNP